MIDEKKLIEELKEYESLQEGIVAEVIETIIEAIEEQPKVGEWIPCSERLPEDRKVKIVYLSSKRMTIALYNEHKSAYADGPVGWEYIFKDGYIDFGKETVIAWMPLPEPYNPKGE